MRSTLCVSAANLRETERDRLGITVRQGDVHLPGRSRRRVGGAPAALYLGNDAIDELPDLIFDRNRIANLVGIQDSAGVR